jgi:hypothetical protein
MVNFHETFCSCNFESRRTIFLTDSFPMVIFQIKKKKVFKDYPHIGWLLFFLFSPIHKNVLLLMRCQDVFKSNA